MIASGSTYYLYTMTEGQDQSARIMSHWVDRYDSIRRSEQSRADFERRIKDSVEAAIKYGRIL
jgi:hypothetical protein